MKLTDRLTMAMYESEHTKFMREYLEKHPRRANRRRRAAPRGGTTTAASARRPIR